MKPTSFLSNIMKASLPIAVLLSTLSTKAQTSPDGHYRSESGQIVIDLKACKQIPCDLQYMYMKVRVVSGQIENGRAFATSLKPLRILSNLPLEQISLKSNATYNTVEKGNRKVSVKACADLYGNAAWQRLGGRQDQIFEVNVVARDYNPGGGLNTSCTYTNPAVMQVAAYVGSSHAIAEDMKNASVPLIAAYQGISEHLNEFRQIVARDSSDARHLARLESQLKSALKVMVDEKGNPLLPVTHRRVTEASRMIMVLSTVLEEIMDKYDFNTRILEPLKPSRDALAQLSKQIRSAYGWEEGLAGSGSKALAALSSILDTELRNMYSQVSAFNSDPQVAQAFNAIFRANSTLYNKVAASNAGDVAGSAVARELLIQWNSSGFQSILNTMMSAPREAQASIQNRILMALTAVESIKDYVDPKGESRINVDLPPNVRSKLP